VNNSSWSCVHGVERWRTNCGCNSGGHAGWNQEWRAPLRAALDWLRDELAPFYEQKAGSLLKDVWAARDEYVQVILNRAEENVRNFLHNHATHPLGNEEQVAALKLLEMQRHAMLMYTSCGWFFDELSGLETVQVMQYAGRAIRLAQDLGANGIESGFMDRLATAKVISRQSRRQTIYEKWVKPAAVSTDQLPGTMPSVLSSSLLASAPRFTATTWSARITHWRLRASKNWQSSRPFQFRSHYGIRQPRLCSLHLGDHNIAGGASHFEKIEDYDQLKASLIDSFSKADTTQALQALTERFSGGKTFSLRTLFRDEQRKIVDLILKESLPQPQPPIEVFTKIKQR